MANLFDDFETFFVSKGLVSVLYKDAMPDEPDQAVAIYQYGGYSPLPQVDGEVFYLQIVVRDTSAYNARLTCTTIYKSLSTSNGIINLTPQRWCLLMMNQTPFKLKVDTSNRTYYVFNMDVTSYID